jgi:hypothetical protein
MFQSAQSYYLCPSLFRCLANKQSLLCSVEINNRTMVTRYTLHNNVII